MLLLIQNPKSIISELQEIIKMISKFKLTLNI
jgi:hypothetical protein